MLHLLHVSSPCRPVPLQFSELISQLYVIVLEIGQGRTAYHRVQGRTGSKLYLGTRHHLHAPIHLPEDLPRLHNHTVSHCEPTESSKEIDAQHFRSTPTIDQLLVADTIASLRDKGDIGYFSVIGDQSFGLLDIYGGLLCLRKRKEIFRNGWDESTTVHVPAL